MITFLEGTIVEKHPTRIVLDVGGVGYEVFVPLSSYDALPPQNERCRVLTYEHIREDTHQLFGFMSERERQMFALLLGISGIGPRLAVSALSGLTVRELTSAIAEGDVKRLSSISGLGRKTAERIVVELKDKLDTGDVLEAAAGADRAAGPGTVAHDAVMALVALGYAQSAAHKMVTDTVRREGEDLTVEEVIRRALAGHTQASGRKRR